MKIFATIAVALFIGTTALPATAQAQACTKRPDVIGHLAEQYSEAPIAIGLTNNGGVIEVLSSAKGGSWTIIITLPDGNSCLIAAGESWEHVKTVANLGPDA